jgi:hypothetical protein
MRAQPPALEQRGRAMHACTLTGFFGRLLRTVDGKVFVILDNLKVHHARPVKTWPTKNAERIEPFHLPSYSSDPHPDEYLNCDLKALIGSKPDSRSQGQLERNALGAMNSIPKPPRRVRNCFTHKSIAYAA